MRIHAFLARCIVALVALHGAFAFAQADCPPEAPQAGSLDAARLQSDVRDRGFLWRLDKDGRSSWLYGTVHASRPEWMVPGPRIQAALAGSDVLALELDPADPELARVFQAAADAPRLERVAGHLRARMERLARTACVPGEQLARMPAMLQLAMLSLADARRQGFHPELAVDAVLWALAQRQGRKIVALETAASQLAALTPATEADERAMVEQGIEDLEAGEGGPLVVRLLQAWARGDEATLASYPQWCRCMDSPAEQRFLRQVNDARNEQMARRLVALHDGGQRFFAAVGALHMTGPKALQVLLRAEGFQVQRIPFSSSPRP